MQATTLKLRRVRWGHRVMPAAIALGLVLVLVFAFAHSAAAQNAGPQPPNNLNFDNNFFVTGDYAVGGVGMVGLANKVSPGYAVGTISMGADTNPGIAGANNSVPQGAEIVVALVYWQTIEIIGGATGQNGFFRPVFSGGPATGYAMQGTPLKNPNGTVYWDGTGCTTGKSSPKQLVTYVAVVTPYLRQDANGNVLAGYHDGTPQTKTAQNYEVKLPSQSNGAPLTLGATLVIIYRVMSPSFPLKSIVIYDGTFSPSSSLLTTTNNIQGFYQSDGTASKLTYIVGNGQKNPSETVTLNGSSPLPSFYGSQPPFPGWYSGGQWDNVTWTFPNASVNPSNPVPPGSITTNSWPSQSVPTVVTSAKAGCVTPAAVIFSTNVSDPDNDGLPPVFKNSKGYCDAASGNGTGACTVRNASSGWVSLDDPTDEPQVGRKDMFVQLDYMVDASNHPLPLLSYSPAYDYPAFTTPNPIDSSGGDVNLGITRLKSALLGSAENLGPIKHNVHLHVFAGNVFQNYSGAITEQTCTDFVSVPGLCGFPAPDAGGYIGWKGNFTDIKNQLVLNGDPGSCTSTSPPASCQPRFQHGRKDSYHYVMLAHAPGLTQWFMSGGTLANVQQTSNAVTFTTSTSHGPLNAIGIVYQTSGGGLTTIDPTTGLPTGALPPLDPNCSNGRVTIGGAITNPNLNGTYCIQSVTDTTFTVNIGGSAATTTYTLATDPDLQVAPGYVSTTSGVSDEGGEDSLITLASWGPRATAKVIGGTIMHETGHSNALTHGGFTFPNAASGDYRPDVETNCKPNFQSVMSYTRQFDLLQYKTGDVVLLGIPLFPVLTDVVDYSEESLHNLVETTAGNPNVFPTAPFYFNTTWYRPSGVVGGTPSITHCDGTQITDGAQYSLLIGPANVNPPACLFCNSALSWNGGDDINFDGPTDASTLVSETLKGQNDWANAAGSINFDQVGATSSLSSTGGGIGAHGGGIGAHGGGIGVQGGGIGAHGGGIGVQGGGIGAHGGGIGAHGGGIGAHGAGEPSLYTTDSSGVHPPTSLSATEDVSPRTITLTWNKPTGTTVADRYKIYRMPAFASGSPLTVPVSSLSCTTTQCTYVDTTDNCVPTGYTYAVSALQAPGTTNESVKSNSVNTTTAGKLLTGCYTNTPPTVTLNDLSFGLPNPAVQGSIVPITWTLQDDDTGAFVKTLAANTNKLSVIGPIAPTGGSCPATPPNSATTTLLSAGGFSATGNQFTVSWNTDTFSAGCYFARLDLDSGQPEISASALQLGIDVTDTDNPQIITVALPSAVVGIPYMNTIMEDGGVSNNSTAFSWTIKPNSVLPGGGSTLPGISFQQNTAGGTTNGMLFGTPTTPGDYTFTAQVKDSVGDIGTQTLKLHVAIPGGLVYIANCTGTCTSISTGNVSGYVIDATSGALIPVTSSPFTAGGSPFWVTVDPAARFAYVANLDGNVTAYSIDAVTGALTPITGSPFSSGGGPSSVTVDPSGRFAYVANRNDGTISAFTINAANGALTAVSSPVATGSQDFTVTVDSSGQFVYVTNLTGNNISAYTIDQTTGALTPVPGSPFSAGTSPYVMAVDPAAPFAYVANNLDNTISAYTIDTTTGALNSISGSPFLNSAGTNNPRSVAVDPLGKYLYTANQNGKVSAFSISATNGALSAVAGSPFATGSNPFSVAVDTTGRFAYVANTGSNNVSAYTINGATGALIEVPAAPPALGSPFAAGTFPDSVAATTYACVAFPAGPPPFASIYSIATDTAGDTFVVGTLTVGTLPVLPLPSVSNERFCNPVTLETNYTVPAYVPSAAERNGDFSAYAGLTLRDQSGNPYAGNIVPAGVFAWRIAPHSSNLTRLPCSLESSLNSIEAHTSPTSTATSITFANDTAGSVNVYWLNYQGQRVFYRGGPFNAVAAGSSSGQQTFITHPWVVTDVTYNRCLGIWLPTESSGTAVITGSVQPPLPPLAPANLNAAVQPSTATTAASVVLTWNASAGAQSYNVYRSTVAAGPFTKLTSVPGAANPTFTDTTVTGGTTYYYLATAVDASSNEGAYSNETVAMILVPPQPPTGLTATPGASGSGAVNLGWVASTSNNVASYNVYRSTTSGAYTSANKIATVAAPATGYPDSGLTSGTTYFYVVTAADASGNEGAFSNEASAVAP